MTAPRVDYVTAHSNGIFKVSTDTDPKKLANAICKALLSTPRLMIRAAGAESVNIATKAWIVADSQLKARGKAIFNTPTFDVVQGKSGSGEVTLIVFNLILTTLEDVSTLYDRNR